MNLAIDALQDAPSKKQRRTPQRREDIKLTKKNLIKKLKDLVSKRDYDNENAHIEADCALLEFINDNEVTKAYNAIEKWYA